MLSLAALFDISVPAVSQHLKVLRDAGLVEERRWGRLRLYSLNPGRLCDISDWLAQYQHFWRIRSQR